MDRKSTFFAEEEEEILQEIPDELPGFSDFEEDEDLISEEVVAKTVEKSIKKPINESVKEVRQSGYDSEETVSNTSENSKTKVLFFDNIKSASDLSKISDEEIISNMEKHFSLQSEHDEYALLENEIKNRLEPLAKLEDEWRELKKDIMAKELMLQEKEDLIKQFAVEIKNLSKKKLLLSKKIKK